MALKDHRPEGAAFAASWRRDDKAASRNVLEKLSRALGKPATKAAREVPACLLVDRKYQPSLKSLRQTHSMKAKGFKTGLRVSRW